MEEPTNNRIVLSELQRTFDKIYVGTDVLDAKLQSILTFASLIISIAATVQISNFASSVGLGFWISLFLVLVVYLRTFWIILRALNPRVYPTTISIDKDEMIENYFSNQTERKILNRLIMNHLAAIQEVKNADEPKANVVQQSFYLLAAVVILLLVAVPLGYIVPHPTLQEFWQSLLQWI